MEVEAGSPNFNIDLFEGIIRAPEIDVTAPLFLAVVLSVSVLPVSQILTPYRFFLMAPHWRPKVMVKKQRRYKSPLCPLKASTDVGLKSKPNR